MIIFLYSIIEISSVKFKFLVIKTRSSRRKRKTQNVSDQDFEINCSSDDNDERGTILLFQSYSLTSYLLGCIKI